MITTPIMKGFKTMIPEIIIKKYNVEIGDKILWKPKEDRVLLKFIKKEDAKNLTGIITTVEEYNPDKD